MPISSSLVVPVEGVDQRDAVKEERAGEPAEHEVLEARLGARLADPLDPGEHVDAERHDLEREEDDQQVGASSAMNIMPAIENSMRA